jgi:hypothetical protein
VEVWDHFPSNELRTIVGGIWVSRRPREVEQTELDRRRGPAAHATFGGGGSPLLAPAGCGLPPAKAAAATCQPSSPVAPLESLAAHPNPPILPREPSSSSRRLGRRRRRRRRRTLVIPISQQRPQPRTATAPTHPRPQSWVLKKTARRRHESDEPDHQASTAKTTTLRNPPKSHANGHLGSPKSRRLRRCRHRLPRTAHPHRPLVLRLLVPSRLVSLLRLSQRRRLQLRYHGQRHDSRESPILSTPTHPHNRIRRSALLFHLHQQEVP